MRLETQILKNLKSDRRYGMHQFLCFSSIWSCKKKTYFIEKSQELKSSKFLFKVVQVHSTHHSHLTCKSYFFKTKIVVYMMQQFFFKLSLHVGFTIESFAQSQMSLKCQGMEQRRRRNGAAGRRRNPQVTDSGLFIQSCDFSHLCSLVCKKRESFFSLRINTHLFFQCCVRGMLSPTMVKENTELLNSYWTELKVL